MKGIDGLRQEFFINKDLQHMRAAYEGSLSTKARGS